MHQVYTAIYINCIAVLYNKPIPRIIDRNAAEVNAFAKRTATISHTQKRNRTLNVCAQCNNRMERHIRHTQTKQNGQTKKKNAPSAELQCATRAYFVLF